MHLLSFYFFISLDIHSSYIVGRLSTEPPGKPQSRYSFINYVELLKEPIFGFIDSIFFYCLCICLCYSIYHSLPSGSFEFNSFTFNLRITALQCCVGFYHTTSGISYKCVYVSVCVYTHTYIFPHSWGSLPPPIPPLYIVTECWAGLLVLNKSFSLAISFTHGSIHRSMLLSQVIPPFPSPVLSTSPLSMPASLFLTYK